MPVQLEIPIFTADVEAHDLRSFERTRCRELVDLCRETNPAKGQRIHLELNAVGSYPNGGLTPKFRRTVRFLTHLRKSERLREDQQPIIRIMIRPRGFKHDDKSAFQTEEIQDFQYSRAELLQMCQWIQCFKACGRDLLSPERGDGFVFGVQRRLDMRLNGLEFDAEANRKLINTARPYPCFLHRAFDGLLSTRQDPDIYNPPEKEVPKSSIEDLVAEVKGLGFKGVLTSGGWGNATDNLETLSELGRAALKENEEDRFELIVGGGVRSGNVWDICSAMKDLAQHRDFWLHSSCYGDGEFNETQARDILRSMKAVEAAMDVTGPNNLVMQRGGG